MVASSVIIARLWLSLSSSSTGPHPPPPPPLDIYFCGCMSDDGVKLLLWCKKGAGPACAHAQQAVVEERRRINGHCRALLSSAITHHYPTNSSSNTPPSATSSMLAAAPLLPPLFFCRPSFPLFLLLLPLRLLAVAPLLLQLHAGRQPPGCSGEVMAEADRMWW